MRTISFPVSNELHSKFKKYCIDKNMTMKEALTLAMEIVLNNQHKP